MLNIQVSENITKKVQARAELYLQELVNFFTSMSVSSAHYTPQILDGTIVVSISPSVPKEIQARAAQRIASIESNLFSYQAQLIAAEQSDNKTEKGDNQ